MEVLQAYDRLEMELGHQTLGPSDGEVEDLKNLLGIAVRQHDPGTGWMLCMMTPSWVEYASALSGVKPIGHRRDYIEHVIDSLRKTLKE